MAVAREITEKKEPMQHAGVTNPGSKEISISGLDLSKFTHILHVFNFVPH